MLAWTLSVYKIYFLSLKTNAHILLISPVVYIKNNIMNPLDSLAQALPIQV